MMKDNRNIIIVLAVYAIVIAAMVFVCPIKPHAAVLEGSVTAECLNCRDRPDVRGNILSVLHEGTSVQIDGRSGNWLAIQCGDIEGWCHASYVQIKDESIRLSETAKRQKYLGNFKISYYTCSPRENGGWSVTAKGQRLDDVVGVCVAADPGVIPYYSEIYIEGIGYRTVMDCGGAIKGNRIDVLVRDNSEIPNCGIHNADVYLSE